MRIFATSDIHMGDGGPRDDFAPRRAEFLMSLPDPDPHDVVVLVGDILDGTRYDIAKCFSANKAILAQLGGLRPWWVVGNHDEEVWKLKEHVAALGFRLVDRMLLVQSHDGEDPPPVWAAPGKPGVITWYICHGHEWDPANKKGSWTGKAATGVANVVGKVWPSAEDWLARQAQKLDGTGRYDQGTFAATVDAFQRQFEGIHGVLAGHTHVREQRTNAFGKRYVNTGTWSKHGWTTISP